MSAAHLFVWEDGLHTMWVRRIIIIRNVNKPTRVCGGCKVMQCPQPYARTQTRTYVQHASISGGFKRGCQARTPPVQILSFSCSFQQKIGKIIDWRTPPPMKLTSPLGNPGSASKRTSFGCVHLFSKRVRCVKKKKDKKTGSNFFWNVSRSTSCCCQLSCVYE